MIGSRVAAVAAAVKAEGRAEASSAEAVGMRRRSACTARKAVAMPRSVASGDP